MSLRSIVCDQRRYGAAVLEMLSSSRRQSCQWSMSELLDTGTRVDNLRVKLLEDMELLAGAVFVPDRDSELQYDTLLEISESLHHLAEAFVELKGA